MKDLSEFKGKNVFVAGGTSGINLGIAEQFAQAGANVAVMSRNPERVEDAVKALLEISEGHLGFAADVRDRESVDKALAGAAEALGPLDIVVSGAAGNFVVDAASISANGFKTVVDIDLIGTFNVFHASRPYLRTPGASLIAISAPQGTHPQVGQIHVCAAKAGVNMVVKCLALEWGPLGIRVNGISPGLIGDTEGRKRLFPSAEAEQTFITNLPIGRMGQKRDIANATMYLSSEFSSFVTGVILDCDGGLALEEGGYTFRDALPPAK
ncbi:SDR family oxidoreductase [Alteromonas lipolytica]|uniref:Short-chain dehydrogenase n=1 Tax=Alteromonas lipolytica TaxID=1856405 RepID=A0A1E8FC60_9ALTE|nr:SDR family oxidoreductase [Alteromonas lipolytica]OFI33495.1 hypothetical protein BFC17_04345 [Alteromonas lipolytica]GGF59143.1 short-chain dehydrogenase [Alteromonas lipolytica]